jgi:hypothetical protein
VSPRDRVHKYRSSGGAVDLVRVEVLVPPANRDQVIADAARLRAEYRVRKARLQHMCARVLPAYATRVFDNLDLARIQDPMQRARVIATALMERGDARAFVAGRRILAELES